MHTTWTQHLKLLIATTAKYEWCSAISYNNKPDKTSTVAEMGDRLATTDMCRKVGGCCAPFRGGSWVPIWNNVTWAKAYLRIKWHLDTSNRLATIHQRYRQTDRTTVL